MQIARLIGSIIGAAGYLGSLQKGGDMEKQTNYTMTRCEATELAMLLKNELNTEEKLERSKIDLYEFLTHGHKLTIIEE